ncbi:MAG: DUF560 domain-containing protein [Alphaproteobacteria bacterium]|nr:DUF560 domain-containing protein [Alphaproteobacteria bacterium]
MKFLISFIVIFNFFTLPIYALDKVESSKTENTEKKVEADKNIVEKDGKIILNPVQIINLAKKFIEDKNYDGARVLLTKSPFNVKELEIERLHLIATIDVAEGKIDDAIEIYRFILDYQPNIPSIRLKLAELYLYQGSYYKADYHFRLAATDKTLPEEVQKNIAMALYFVRQNKNWNFWFNFGAAPDNNVNNATGGEQCINYYGMILCNQLSDKEKAVGFNVSFGGNYEFKLSDRWRIRNEAVVYNSTYNKSEYDDLYLGYVIGPKYVWQRGDVFTGITMSRRWLDHQPYNKTLGGRIDLDYDFTKHLSGAISTYYTPTDYDDYGEYLDGDLRGVRTRLFYTFDASKYIALKFGYEKENTEERIYSNTKKSYGIGFGAELPYGFSMYLEPSILYTNYDKERSVVKDYAFVDIKEKDITRKYALSLSNRNIKFWGFVPTLTYVYTDKSSNIWQKEYSKSTVEFTVNQRF